MDNDSQNDQAQNTPIEPVAETPVPASVPVEPESSHPTGSTPVDMPPEAPESPTDASAKVLTEDQNQEVNQPESNVPETPNEPPISGQSNSETPVQVQPVSATTPPTPPTPQPQSPVQQDQTGFIHVLLAKAQAKIQSNKQKKLDKIMLFAQKKKIIANEDIQLLLHISSATATRYLVKLVQQGRLARVGNPRDAKYQFVR